ncbi:MAG TPA: DUF1080 domain-containing protein [Bryobacteraceae bacterium]|nr:DUF1080 domain-containing protein [Bryobacteraceae bacterium]
MTSINMRYLLPFLLLLPLAAEEGFVSLFNGKNLDGWFIVNQMGPGFLVKNGLIVCPFEGGQKLMTEKEYANFVLRLDYRLEADSNNGIGIRAPRNGQTSVHGMEIQILDQSGPKYGPAKLKPEQYNGSIYDVWPARTGFLRKPGEWNEQEIIADGRRITIRLNGVTVLNADLDDVQEPEVLKKHPGLQRRSGHIVLLGHQAHVEFRNIRIKELP